MHYYHHAHDALVLWGVLGVFLGLVLGIALNGRDRK